MTKQEFLVLASSKYESLQKLNENLNFYDYEKAFDELWSEFGRSVLEKNISQVPENCRKKTQFGLGMGKLK